MLHADPSHKCYHLLQCTGWEGEKGRGGKERGGEGRGGERRGGEGREGEKRGGEGRGGEGRGEEESGSGCEERLSNVSTGQQRVAKLTTFFPLWGGMNLGWMKEQPLARASNGPGPGGR